MLSMLLNQKIKDADKYILKHWSNVSPYYTGIRIKANDVYAICPGTVIAVGKSDDSHFDITIQVNSEQLIRYCNMKNINVDSGDVLNMHDCVGNADKYIHFEYCSQSASNWPVRVHNRTWYKNNPEGLLDGTLQLNVYYDFPEFGKSEIERNSE